MGYFLLRLVNRDEVVHCQQAADAYHWIDQHGRPGEAYDLAWIDEDAGTVTEIERDTVPAIRPLKRRTGKLAT